MTPGFRSTAAVLALLVWLAPAAAQQPSDPLAAMDRMTAAAEMNVRAGEMETAESQYRSVLFEAWMAAGALHVAANRLADARDAFRHASTTVVEADAALRSLAAVHLEMQAAAEAVAILTRLSGRAPADLQTRRLLAQALVAEGRAAEAVQVLEEGHAAAPEDPEIAFLLASGYLRIKKVTAAERLFAQVATARPMPQTWVLIGRTYRDAGLYDAARAAFHTALKKDPRTRRANYYLGTIALLEDGVVRLDDAIASFRRELSVSPDDAAARLRLGMALVDARRAAEAIAPLQSITKSAPDSAEAWHYLGRAQLAQDRAGDAVASLRRALELARASAAKASQLQDIHYQLGLALRQAGATDEAAAHFREAKEASGRRAEAERERLGKYLSGAADSMTDGAPPRALQSPFEALPPATRDEIGRRARAMRARAYLNLGVMRAQARQFERAAEFFEQAAASDPAFPMVQYSLGVARFNAEQFDKAVTPLERALAADPPNAAIRRMLALAHLNAGAYGKAAELLATDPSRESDPSLQYAYGLALVRSDQAATAQNVFSRLLSAHGTVAELHVILGQAHAQQGNYDAAVQSLARALELKADVADAHAALGLIYLKQGKLADAATSLRAELRAHPANVTARQTLATVLDLDGQSAEAMALLREILARKPDFGDARYLLGKILLAQDAPQQALPYLESAVRLSPEEASYHYQLAQAYLKLGRRELADRHFATFRELKAKKRGGAP